MGGVVMFGLPGGRPDVMLSMCGEHLAEVDVEGMADLVAPLAAGVEVVAL